MHTFEKKNLVQKAARDKIQLKYPIMDYRLFQLHNLLHFMMNDAQW